MPLTVGSRLGPYEIVAPLGAGGMGEVYRARDTKLDRQVALKILPESFTADPDRLMRFEREAKALAALNHPNIAQVYGVEDSAATRAIVMELVEGPTLEEMLHGARRLPPSGTSPGSRDPGLQHDGGRVFRPGGLQDALAIARQICEALEYAHERGIVHRDLKPANVKVGPDDTVKVLDFGLAKMLEAPGPDSGSQGPSTERLANSPTMTSPALTAMGLILGTAAYMAPEQAKGKPVDKRADIWAFGCVLYEMLTGRRAFEGEDVSDVLVAVLSKDVDFTALPASTPPRVRRLIARCLDRNVKTRLRDIGEARITLAQPDEAGAEPGGTVAASGRTTSRRLVWAAAAGGLVAGGVLGIVLASRVSRPAGAATPPARTLVLATDGRGLSDSQAISPDGRFVAYTAAGALWIRNLGELEARKVPGSDGAEQPFWSPRSDAVAFAAKGVLYKVAPDGSQPVELCRLQNGAFVGAAWSAVEGIVFTVSRANWNGEVLRVPESGGDPTTFATADPARGERRLAAPYFLPDGRTLLYAVTTVSNNTGELAVDRNGTRTLLHLDGMAPVYDQRGRLFFLRYESSGADTDLWAVGFSLSTLSTIGTPVLVARHVGGASVSADGTLVYARLQPDPEQLVWVDRTGSVRGPVGEMPPSVGASAIDTPAVAPDGAHVAADSNGGIVVWDSARGIATQLGAGSNGAHPSWLPGGQEVVYFSGGSPPRILARPSDGSGDVRVMLAAGGLAPDVSADGTYMAFYRVDPKTQRDVWAVKLDKLRAVGDPFSIAQTPANEAMPQISPDGKWVAYESDESGRWEVFVQPFPGGGRRQPVSVNGGADPMWNRQGGELFFTSGNDLMAVAITTTPALRVGTPHRLFSGDAIPTELTTPSVIERIYAPAPDGRRFVVAKGVGVGKSEVILSEGAPGPAS